MRKREGLFSEWVRAEGWQMAAYEEAKNKDYTGHLSERPDAILSDFRRHNYFLLKNENFQSKQDQDFSPEQVKQLEQKIQSLCKSPKLAGLIASIGGQALQAPLSVLEFLHFKQDNESLASVCKFDLSLFFQCEDELRHVSLNFSYVLKNPKTDKNYLVDHEDQLLEISDQDCQQLSSALNRLSQDLQAHLGLAIPVSEEPSSEIFSIERAARNIARAFARPEKLEMASLISLVESEIRPLIRVYLSQRRERLLEGHHFSDEFQSIENLQKMPLKPIHGGADHMAFFSSWSHLQVSCPEKEWRAFKQRWAETHKPGDILVIKPSPSSTWQIFKIRKNKRVKKWNPLSAAFLAKLLEGVGPHTAEAYDYTILRDLLGVNTRAIRQIELVLAKNTEGIQNHFASNKRIISPILERKNSMVFEASASRIKKVFFSLLREQHAGSLIRPSISMKELGPYFKALSLFLNRASLRRELSQGEFLQWVSASIVILIDHFKKKSAIRDSRVQGYYEAELFPKIERARKRILAKREAWLFRVFELDLSPESIGHFSNDLQREVIKLFMSYPGAYGSLPEACHALYGGVWAGFLKDNRELEEFIYRLAYMASQNAIDVGLIDILLHEALHFKISRQHQWDSREADLFRRKSKHYLNETEEILKNLKRKILLYHQIQFEEKKKAFVACHEIRQKAEEFLKTRAGGEYYVAGMLMSKLADDVTEVVSQHYKNPVVFEDTKASEASRHEALILKVNAAIDLRMAHEELPPTSENWVDKIKTYVLNIFLAVFTLGALPAVRRFILKKPAFFGLKSEIAEEVRAILSCVP